MMRALSVRCLSAQRRTLRFVARRSEFGVSGEAFLKITRWGGRGTKVPRRDRRIGASQIAWKFEEYEARHARVVGRRQLN